MRPIRRKPSTSNGNNRKRSIAKRKYNKKKSSLSIRRRSEKIDLAKEIRQSNHTANQQYPHESNSVIYLGPLVTHHSTVSVLLSGTSNLVEIPIISSTPVLVENDQEMATVSQENENVTTAEPAVLENSIVEDVIQETPLPPIQDNSNSSVTEPDPDSGADENQQQMHLQILIEIHNEDEIDSNTNETAIADGGDNIPNSTSKQTENVDTEGTLFQEFTAYLFGVFSEENNDNDNDKISLK